MARERTNFLDRLGTDPNTGRVVLEKESPTEKALAGAITVSSDIDKLVAVTDLNLNLFSQWCQYEATRLAAGVSNIMTWEEFKASMKKNDEE